MSDYNRITRRNEDGTTWVKCVCCENVATCDYTKESCCQLLQDRLAELEDMIEQNVLIKLPCKVGDKVWLILHEDVYEYEVYGFYIANLGHSGQVNLRTCDFKKNEKIDGGWLQCIGISFDDFSEAVFLTKAEAEAKLEELKRGEND